MSGVAADAEFAFALRALNLQTLGTVGGKPAWLSASRVATAPLGRGQGRPGRGPRLRDPASAEGNARRGRGHAVAAGRSLGPGRRAKSRLVRLRRRVGEERRRLDRPGQTRRHPADPFHRLGADARTLRPSQGRLSPRPGRAEGRGGQDPRRRPEGGHAHPDRRHPAQRSLGLAGPRSAPGQGRNLHACRTHRRENPPPCGPRRSRATWIRFGPTAAAETCSRSATS